MRTRRRLVAVAAITLSGAATACSGGNSSSELHGDAATGGEDGNARHDSGHFEFDAGAARVDATGRFDALPPLPQVVNAKGAVLANPVVVAVFFSNEDKATLPTLEKYYSGLVASKYWAALAEYGIGSATTVIKVLSQAAPATIDDTQNAAGTNTDLENWLLAEVANGDLPATTDNTEFIINYPAGTNVTANGTQCVDFDGYHTDMQNAAGTITYAYGVVPHCTDMGFTYLETFGATVSHEVIEAATDPFPDYSPGWSQADTPHLFWDEANTGSEIGDMCQNDPEAYYQFSDFAFTVQRFWSNKSVTLGHDPCVPEIPGATFFIGIPELPAKGPFLYNGTNVDVDSVNIPVGGSATVYVDLHTDGALPDFDVQAFDYNEAFNGGSALLLFDMPTTVGNDGDRLPVVIHVAAAGDPNTNGQVANSELFVIQASQGTSATAPAHYWYGVVTN